MALYHVSYCSYRGHRTGSIRFPIKETQFGYPTISIRSPYGSDSKHRRKPEQEIVALLTQRSLPMSKIVGKIADRKTYDNRGKCNLGINTILSLLIVKSSCNAYNAYYFSIYSNNLTTVLMCAIAHINYGIAYHITNLSQK